MNQKNHPVQVWGVIPAAGMSRRMGRPKQSMRYRDTRYGDTTMLGAVCRTLLKSGVAGVVVVSRTELLDALDLPESTAETSTAASRTAENRTANGRVRLAVNDNPNSEMIDSIRIALDVLDRDNVLGPAQHQSNGIKAQHKCQCRSVVDKGTGAGQQGVLVVPGDMPMLTTHACRVCIDAFVANPDRIVIATYAARQGHPMIFPFAMRKTINRLDEGLNALTRIYPDRLLLVETDDPGTIHDINTPKQSRIIREER